jgi:hypothetical protein
MRIKTMAVLAMLFTLSLAGTALAQDNPTEDAYGGVLGEEVGNQDDSGAGTGVGGGNETAVAVAGQDAGSGSLPFTGLEVGLVALAGIGLLALGFAMRRTTRGSPGA